MVQSFLREKTFRIFACLFFSNGTIAAIIIPNYMA